MVTRPITKIVQHPRADGGRPWPPELHHHRLTWGTGEPVHLRYPATPVHGAIEVSTEYAAQTDDYFMESAVEQLRRELQGRSFELLAGPCRLVGSTFYEEGATFPNAILSLSCGTHADDDMIPYTAEGIESQHIMELDLVNVSLRAYGWPMNAFWEIAGAHLEYHYPPVVEKFKGEATMMALGGRFEDSMRRLSLTFAPAYGRHHLPTGYRL